MGGNQIVLGESVAGRRFEAILDIRSVALQLANQLFAFRSRNVMVLTAGSDQDGNAAQIEILRRRIRQHRSQQSCTGDGPGPAKQQTHRDVRAVGQPDRDHLSRIEAVVAGGNLDEIGQFVGPLEEIGNVELSDRKTAKEPWHPVLEDLATRTENPGFRGQLAPQRDQIVLVAAGPMQKQQGPRRVARFEGMDEALVGDGPTLRPGTRKPAESVADKESLNSATLPLRASSKGMGLPPKATSQSRQVTP